MTMILVGMHNLRRVKNIKQQCAAKNKTLTSWSVDSSMLLSSLACWSSAPSWSCSEGCCTLALICWGLYATSHTVEKEDADYVQNKANAAHYQNQHRILHLLYGVSIISCSRCWCRAYSVATQSAQLTVGKCWHLERGGRRHWRMRLEAALSASQRITL